MACDRRIQVPLALSFIASAWGIQSNAINAAAPESALSTTNVKFESFDRDPGWEGVNNRSAQHNEPRSVRQDFGYSATSAHAGGGVGEIGGFIAPAGEAAFYAKKIEPADLEHPLIASGTLAIGDGGTHFLLGFFDSATLNEWRTPNTIAFRLNGRGDKFFAYVEYCTAKWRAGGDSTPFPSVTDPQTGRWSLIGYPTNQALKWSLKYDPTANNGNGSITATIGNDTAICNLDPTHKRDGATFTHFGIVNIIKSADSGSEAWFDNIAVNNEPIESFDKNPNWDSSNNRRTYQTRLVRPWFDFGFSDTNFAGGKRRGELGGQIFRGDCRETARMACYGDRIGPLSARSASPGFRQNRTHTRR